MVNFVGLILIKKYKLLCIMECILKTTWKSFYYIAIYITILLSTAFGVMVTTYIEFNNQLVIVQDSQMPQRKWQQF